MKYVNIFIVLFFTQYIWSQTTIDVDADYIMVDKGQLTFLKEKNDTIHSKTEIRFYPVGSQLGKEIKTTSVEVTAYDIKRFHDFSNAGTKYSYVVDVSNIKKQKTRKLVKKLQKGKFYYEKSAKEIRQLSYYNLSSFKYSVNYNDAQEKDTVTKWGSYEEKLINFVVVNLKGKKPIVVFPYIKSNPTYDEHHRSDEKFLITYLGVIIPQKKTHIVKYYNELFEHSATAYPFLKGIRSNQDKTPNWSYNFEFKDSQLKDRVFGQALLDKKFDTIIINNGFIFCHKDDKTMLYNLELKDITPKGLQAAFPIAEEIRYAICLIDNAIYYVSKKGLVFNELPEKVIVSICGFDYPNKGVVFSIESDEKSYMLSHKSSYLDFDNNAKTEIVTHELFDKHLYETVFFMNNQYQVKLPTTFTSNQSRATPEYIVVENKGKFGLLSIAIIINENRQPSPIELKELLPIEYDVIKTVKGNHILITKDSLFGIYGLTEVKYTKLDVSEHFSRFTLPNGQKGWLDKLGREFLDE